MQPAEHRSAEPAARDVELSPGERRLAASRAALAELLRGEDADAFPRSETMRFLLGGKGRMIALGSFAGLVAVKPKLALALLRFMPLGRLLPIARILHSLR